jgi:hypothetical protein
LFPPSENIGQPPVQKLVDAFGVDVTVGVNAQDVLREVLGCLTPNLLAACFTVEARVVARAIQGTVGLIVRKWETLMRAYRGETNDVAIGANSIGYALAELEQHAGRIVIWITDVQWLVYG